MIDRSKYNAEDFLIDNSFQLYCAGKDATCVNYWENWLKEHPEKTETVIEAKRIYALLSGNKKPLANQMSQLADKIEHPMPTKKLWVNWKFLSAAASIIIICAVSLYFFNEKQSFSQQAVAQEFTTKTGERKKVVLPDGSTVFLNAKSSLKLGKGFNKSCREVTLDGEAYFDVTHDKSKPFKVYTADFNINVLGTAFNVKAYHDEIMSEATLIRGLITMESNNGNGGLITLKPSQKVTFYKNTAKKIPATLENTKIPKYKPEISINHYTVVKDSTIVETAWTQNRIEIYDQDFQEIKEVLEKWYNVEIKFSNPELETYRFTATFSNENIKQVLEALQKVENFKYEIKKNQIFISK